MFDFAFPNQTPLRQAVTDAYRRDEIEAVQDMLQRAQMSDEERKNADELARRLVTQVRANRTKASGVDARIFPVERRRRGADVPGRSPAAHSRCRNPQQTYSRQIVRRKLAQPLEQ